MKMEQKVKFEFGNHGGNDVILIRFEKNQVLNERVKKLVGVRWSQSKKAWYVLDSLQYRQKFGLNAKSEVQNVSANIHEINQPAFKKLVEMLQLKAYSPSTIKTYRNEFAQLLYILKTKNVDELDAEKLRSYFLLYFRYH